ncbi:hypothetical protein B0H14DRAFT_2643171 [Mycena olivaceomarginata]|nr:hypothetical protein B0H14DRAFT_2643171 [Mycena olivaceomarginata]
MDTYPSAFSSYSTPSPSTPYSATFSRQLTFGKAAEAKWLVAVSASPTTCLVFGRVENDGSDRVLRASRYQQRFERLEREKNSNGLLRHVHPTLRPSLPLGYTLERRKLPPDTLPEPDWSILRRKDPLVSYTRAALEDRCMDLEKGLLQAHRLLGAHEVISEGQNAQLILQNIGMDKMKQTLFEKEKPKKNDRSILFSGG